MRKPYDNINIQNIKFLESVRSFKPHLEKIKLFKSKRSLVKQLQPFPDKYSSLMLWLPGLVRVLRELFLRSRWVKSGKSARLTEDSPVLVMLRLVKP